MQVQGRLFATALVVLSTLVLPLSYSQSTNSGTNPAPVNPPASNPAPDPQAAAQASQKAQKATAANSNVEQAVASANALVQTAQRYQKTISGVTSATTQRTQPAIEDLHTLQTTLIAIQQNNIPGKLTDALNQLDPKPAKGTSLESTRKAACTDLSQPAVPQQDVTDALKACAKVEADAASLKGALNAQLSLNDPDSLATALQSIYPYISNQIGSYLSKLDALSKVPAKTDTPAATLLQKLPPGLTSLREVLASQQEYQMVWNNTLKPILAQLKVSAPATDTSGKAVPAVDDQITSLTTRTGQIVANLNVWFPVLSTSLQDSATGLDALLTGVQTDPAARNAAALDKIRDGSDDLTSAQSIVDAWPPLVGFLVDGTPEGFSLRTAKQEFLKLQRATNALRISIARLSDTVGGDASGFETAQVSLYYFFDVNRLMTALNGNTRTIGGVAEAQAAAAEQRKSLAQAELDLADAQATVNRYQKQVLDLQEQQRQLREKLKGLDTSLSKLGNRLKSAQDAKGTADELVKKAQADQTANANDPAKATAVDKATAAQTTAAGKASQSQSDYDSAKADHDNVQGQLDGSQNQSDSLPAKLAAAQQALSDSQTAVSRERRRMLLAAQAESDAFAFARDNAPFLYAQADASSTDPAKRVFLYAFNDSKSIFMRGKPDDINEVKHIIAEFDKPAPQARLTLWTFQLNADANGKANKDAAQKLNDSMAMIDEELSNSRALENTTLTLLRDLVNREVRNAAAQHEKQCATNPALCKGLDGADLEKFHRLSFYDVKILSQLGINPDNPDPKKRWREVVPDPAGTTTLGEALIVLSLGRPEIRAGVRQEFESKIPGLLQNLHVKSWPPEDGTPSVMLPLTWHALGIWEPGTVDGAAGLTSQQLEITRALKTWYESRQIKAALDKLAALSSEFTLVDRRLDDIDLEVNDLKERATSKLNALDQKRLIDLQKLSKPSEPEQAEINKLVQSGINQLPASDRSNYSQKTFAQRQLNARRHNIIKAMPATQVLESHGIDVESVITDRPEIKALGRPEDRVRRLTLQLPGLSTASPRVAAADEMLKELIIALEDDLSRDFVQPMINRIRMRLAENKGVRVGILQRESMLATNRGKARIDPRASAQLAVGTEMDILTGIQQLAQLYAVVQSGGTLAALGALQQQPREPAPEIYALTTGNKFEVTPIFDPSGQALRFKFDYVSSTNIQEPNGSTSTQLPRIERHTINTEVQLSNLETREISRFESNARLGRPTEYKGGIPVLKDIPYVRPWIPLVGWFVRKAGSNAVAQQSVIFGQTTIYPTIGALIDLTTDSGEVTEQSNERKHQ